MRNVIIASAVLFLSPSAVLGQTATSVAYRPNAAAARLQGDAVRAQAFQDTAGTTVNQDRVDNSVAYGAAIGGIVGTLAVVVHTVADSQEDPLNWAVAVATPIVAGLIGAGVGWLVR